MNGLVFGEKEEGIRYVERPSVYGLVIKEDKIAIMKMDDGRYFLPGGGKEPGETDERTLRREFLEETGRDIENIAFVGRAELYYYSERYEKHFFNEGAFYTCDMIGEGTGEHELVWLTFDEAIDKLSHDHQRWAVEKVR